MICCEFIRQYLVNWHYIILRIGIGIMFPDAFSFAASGIAANGLTIGGSGSGTVPAPRLEGTLLKMINEAIAYLDTQVKEKTYLGPEGTFVTDEEYPKFVRQVILQEDRKSIGENR